MEKQIIELLEKVLANQAVIFHRIDELYNGQQKHRQRVGYDEEKAREELNSLAKKLISKG